MFGFGKPKQGKPAQIQVGKPLNLSLERRVARVKRLRAAIARGNGGEERVAKLQAELDGHMEALVAHKSAVESLLEESK